MKRLGYVEGVNLIVDRYSAEGRFDRFPEIASDVVAKRPDVIYAVSTRMTRALQSQTRTIPIVAWTDDPVAAGIVSSLAHPGGNITGVSVDAGLELGAKHLQLLSEAVGKLSNVRVLATPPSWQEVWARTYREAAEKMNISLRLEPLRTPIDEAEYRRAFDAMQRDHVDGVLMSHEPESYTHGRLLGRLAQEYRIPAICHYSESAEAGALMSYDSTLQGELGASVRRSLKFSMAASQQRCRIFRKAIGSWSSTSRRPKSLALKYLQGWSHKLTG